VGLFFLNPEDPDMNNIFFTADTHFSHPDIIRYCNRPFIKEGDLDKSQWVSKAIALERAQWMDETIITNWNNKVKMCDTVYHLGDFCFMNKREDILKLSRERLNGHIILIEGNHDGNIGSPGNFGFSSKHQRLEVKIEGCHITLSHYAMRTWPKSHYDSWCLYGHSHGCLPGEGKSMDVGVDANGFAPLSFEEVKAIMEKLSLIHI